MLQNLYKQKMGEYCTLNFIPATRMAAMVEKFVSCNEAHCLETFFDHEVFRQAYTDMKKQFLEFNMGAKKSFRECQDDIERHLRAKVKEFLKAQFVEDEEQEEVAQVQTGF